MKKLAYIVFGSILSSIVSSVYAFDEKQLAEFEQTKKCIGCDLSGARLAVDEYQGAVLTGSKLNEIDAFARKFNHAELANTVWDQGTLTWVDFRGANLAGASFKGANLSSANFFGAKNITDDQILQATSKTCFAILPSGAEAPCRHQ